MTQPVNEDGKPTGPVVHTTDWCWMERGAVNPDGDPIRVEMSPVCFRKRGHSGYHVSYAGAGKGEVIMWPHSGYDRTVPEALRFRYYTPPEGVFSEAVM